MINMDNNMLNEVKQAIAEGNIELAREKLREALKIALDERQARFFLEKAVELDPFNETAHAELQKITAKTSVALATFPVHEQEMVAPPSYLNPGPPSAKSPRNLWTISGIVVATFIAGLILLTSLSASTGSSQAAATATPARPTPTPTPIPVVLAKSFAVGQCKLPEITSVNFLPGARIQACLTPKEIGQFQNIRLFGRLLIDGKPAPYASMSARLNYRFFPEIYTKTADSNGLVEIAANTTLVSVNFIVTVDIVFDYNGQKYSLPGTNSSDTTFITVPE
jgi:hypothetical protein